MVRQFDDFDLKPYANIVIGSRLTAHGSKKREYRNPF